MDQKQKKTQLIESDDEEVKNLFILVLGGMDYVYYILHQPSVEHWEVLGIFVHEANAKSIKNLRKSIKFSNMTKFLSTDWAAKTSFPAFTSYAMITH